ncbi:hypothetical protein D5S18_29895 [Nocardia panacis]|uniref:HTH luxR-type domain-containing protein n=1 Tax=Nocardia panacis TaxID=2340916 RepID=A0A3A4KLA9_9NOCA|nr:LuxR family transcriptional regulator [Nocardia panacis]RJO70069.1 hypothetical protein D5S18_29895 [Nocardia panacis]
MHLEYTHATGPAFANSLVDRAAELGVLAHHLTNIATGPLILVEGGAGTGRTALLAAGADAARGLGHQVLTVTASRYESELPAQLIHRLRTHADPSAAITAPHSLFRWITEQARRTPLLLVIDDLHWSDRESLHCLAYLVRRLPGHPVGVLASHLPAHPSPDPVLLTELRRSSSRIVLRPFSARMVGALIDPGRHGGSHADRLCDNGAGRCGSGGLFGIEGRGIRVSPVGVRGGASNLSACLAEWTGGNPYLLNVALSQPDWCDCPAKTREQSGYAARTVYNWLRSRLPPVAGCLECVGAAAILGSNAEPTLIAAAVGITVRAAEEAVQALSEIGFLTGGAIVEFAQPMVRAAVLAAISPEQRARVLVAAGARLVEIGAADERVLELLLDGEVTEYDDAARLVSALLDRMVAAAASVLARVELLRRVLARPTARSLRAHLLALLGTAETDTDPAAAQTHLAEAARLATDPWLRAQLVFQRASALLLLDRGIEAAGLLRCLALDSEVAQSGLLDRIAVLLAELAIRHPDLPAGEPPTGTGGSAKRIANLLADSGSSGGGDLSWHQTWQLLSPAGRLGLPLTWSTLSTLSEAPPHRQLPYTTAWVTAPDQGPLRKVLAHAAHANVLLALGRISRAAIETDRAIAQLAQVTVPPAIAVAAFGPLIETLLERDDLPAANRLLAEADLNGPLPTRPTNAALLLARGRLRHACGDPGGALADILAAARCGPPIPWRANAIPVLLELGRHDTARALACTELAAARALAGVDVASDQAIAEVDAVAVDSGERPAVLTTGEAAGTGRGDPVVYADSAPPVAVREHPPGELRDAPDLPADEVADLALAEAELARTTGEFTAARETAEQALGIALRLAGQAAGPSGLGMLTESVALSTGMETARALGELGIGLARVGRVGQARQRLRRALVLAEGAGAVRLGRILAQRLRDAGGRVPGRIQGPESLTASERRVARLAATGRTNRQIADELFVTRRAVEMHLTQAYRKLGIGGRGDLREVLGRDGRRQANQPRSASSAGHPSWVVDAGAGRAGRSR